MQGLLLSFFSFFKSSCTFQSITPKYFFFLIGVRDYIHVVDLAVGHVIALKQFENKCGCKVKLSFPADP